MFMTTISCMIETRCVQHRQKGGLIMALVKVKGKNNLNQEHSGYIKTPLLSNWKNTVQNSNSLFNHKQKTQIRYRSALSSWTGKRQGSQRRINQGNCTGEFSVWLRTELSLHSEETGWRQSSLIAVEKVCVIEWMKWSCVLSCRAVSNIHTMTMIHEHPYQASWKCYLYLIK